MAVTKIHGIKTTVNKAIEYICNPDKTDQNLYISSFACSPETAALDFKYTLDHTHNCRDPHNTNKAFHLIQAFSPGEVSYEEAHQIGKELADRLLEGKYSYVLTTHTDKGHVHNHLIFCSADNITFSHYHDCKKNYWKIRNLSDTLCLEHNLSTINTTNNITTAKGMRDHNFALVYPILKNNGICIPVIVEKTKNDKPDPSIISGALKIAFPHITKPRYRIIIATIPAR